MSAATITAITTEDSLRTTPVPQEIWDVVGVVLGEHPQTLTGWQRDDAIRAMSALGNSITHMAWALRLHPITVEKRARRLRVSARKHDARVDFWGVVHVLRGVRIPLTGRDRIAAIRLLAACGYNSAEIADRLCMPTAESARKLATDHGIEVVPINATPYELNSYRRRQRPEKVLKELMAA